MKKSIWIIIITVLTLLAIQITGFLTMYWLNVNFTLIANVFLAVAISLITIKLVFFLTIKISKKKLHSKIADVELESLEIARGYVFTNSNHIDKYDYYLKQVKILHWTTISLAILNLFFAVAISIIFAVI